MYEVGEMVALRAAFGPALTELARTDERIFVVTADLGGSVGLAKFKDEFPDRFVNCGVAEQSMIAVSAGAASEGYLPVAVTFGSFIGRTLDHLRQSFGHNKLPGLIVGSHGGISNGQDGPSAHAIEDLGFMRSMPGMKVVAPSCANQLPAVLRAVVEEPRSVFLRLYREPTPTHTKGDEPFVVGKFHQMAEGHNLTVVATGPHAAFVREWLAAKPEVSVDFFEASTVEPLDEDALVVSAKKTGRVLTVEDHFIRGGLGSAVAETLSEKHPTLLRRMALHDYARSGPYYALLDAVGLGSGTFWKLADELIAR